MKLSSIFIVLVAIGAAVGLGLVTLSAVRAPDRDHITPAEYQNEFAGTDHLLVDVRRPEEFAAGHIPGAVNLPLETLADHLNELPLDQPVIVYCHSGNRSGQAFNLLSQAGYENLHDLGGIMAWEAAGLPVVQST